MKSRRRAEGNITGLIIALMLLPLIWISFVRSQSVLYIQETKEVKYSFPIYKATVTFGIFTKEGSGKGVLFFGSGVISSDSSESETYIIKYMEGQELKTVSYKAIEKPLIVDGLFQIDFIYNNITTISKESSKVIKYETVFIDTNIHIPYLPNVQSNMTENWSD